MSGGSGGKPFTSRLWELVILLIVLSIASQMAMLYIVPLLPYAFGVVAVGGVVWLIASRYRRW